MVSSKTIITINIALGITAFILVLSLLGVTIPSVGNALYVLDPNEAVCITNYKDNYNLISTDLCCTELQQQLVKGEESNQVINMNNQKISVNKHYYTSTNTINYFINNKAYHYCKNNGFLV